MARHFGLYQDDVVKREFVPCYNFSYGKHSGQQKCVNARAIRPTSTR
jgi:hypothetical protein